MIREIPQVYCITAVKLVLPPQNICFYEDVDAKI